LTVLSPGKLRYDLDERVSVAPLSELATGDRGIATAGRAGRNRTQRPVGIAGLSIAMNIGTLETPHMSDMSSTVWSRAVQRIVTNPLWLLPAAVLGIGLASLFFAIFLSIFAAAAVVLGLRFYWWRRDLERAGRGKTLEGEYIVIEKRKATVRRNDDPAP
jgi:hypothetical protein